VFRKDLPETNPNNIMIIDDQDFNFVGFGRVFDD